MDAAANPLSDAWAVASLGQETPPWWDEALTALGPASPRQSSAWIAYTREYYGSRPIHLAMKDGDDKIVGLLVMFKEAWQEDRLIRSAALSPLRRLARLAAPVLTWADGPTLAPEATVDRAWPIWWAAIRDQVGRTGAIGVQGATLAPFRDRAYPQPWLPGPEYWKPRATLLVELTPDAEEQRKRIKHAARKAINKCLREGVEIVSVDDPAGADRFEQCLNDHRRELGLGPVPTGQTQIKWRLMQPGLRLFVARLGEDWLAGMGCQVFGRVVWEFGSFRNAAACAGRKINPGDLLKWEIMNQARSRGAAVYDLAGVPARPGTTPGLDAPEPSQKEKNILRFKEKWGGVYADRPVLNWLATPRGRALSGVERLGRRLTGKGRD